MLHYLSQTSTVKRYSPAVRTCWGVDNGICLLHLDNKASVKQSIHRHARYVKCFSGVAILERTGSARNRDETRMKGFHSGSCDFFSFPARQPEHPEKSIHGRGRLSEAGFHVARRERHGDTAMQRETNPLRPERLSESDPCQGSACSFAAFDPIFQ